MSATAILVVSIVSGFAMLAGLFKPFFGGWYGFRECVRFWLTPDIISMFRGEWEEDWMAEMKLFWWIGAAAAVGFLVNMGLTKLLG